MSDNKILKKMEKELRIVYLATGGLIFLLSLFTSVVVVALGMADTSLPSVFGASNVLIVLGLYTFPKSKKIQDKCKAKLKARLSKNINKR